MSHRDKTIRAAITYAIDQGWRVVPCGPRAHCHCRLFAPDGVSIFTVYGTPRSPDNHAKAIRRAVDRHAGEKD